MSQPYIGEIRLFAGNFAPNGWAFCDGSILSISQFETLFFLLGTTYGGDGQVTFQLPDLRGRFPVHMGTGPGLPTYVLGQQGGQETVTLTVNQLPPHSHPVSATDAVGHLASPEGNIPAGHRDGRPRGGVVDGNMAAGSLLAVGNGQPHENMPPYLGVNFIISTFGIFPSPP